MSSFRSLLSGFLLFVLPAGALQSQTISISRKYTTQQIENAEWQSFICNNHLYVVSWKTDMRSPIGRQVQLDAFDNNGEFISSSGIIDATMSSTEPNLFKGIFPLTDRVVMFKANFKKEGDKKHLDLFYYPFSNLTQRDKGTFLTSINSESMTNSGNYFIATSPGGNHIAVIGQHPYVKNAREKITIRVYDNSFKELWNRSYEFPFDNSKYPDNDVWINNSGTVFILKNVDNKEEGTYQSLFTFKSNEVRYSKIDIGQNNKLAQYEAVFNLQGNLILAGYYCHEKKFGVNLSYPKGSFYLKADHDGNLVTGSQEETLSMGMKLYRVLAAENDGVILTGAVLNVHNTPVPERPLEYDYEYVSGHILLYKINSSGKKEWEYTVSRDIRRINDGGRAGSVFACMRGENIALIYTDHYYKYDGGGQKIIGPGRLKKFINAIQDIDKNGKLISDSYIKGLGNDKSDETVQVYLIPATGRQNDEGRVLFMGYSDKILYGIRLTF